MAVLRDVCPPNRFNALKRWNKSEPPWRPEEIDKVIIDSFETPLTRSSDNKAQHRMYLGKKKRHTLSRLAVETLKSQTVTDASGEILEVTLGHRGPASDKRLYEQLGVAGRYPAAEKQGNLGYKRVIWAIKGSPA